MADTTLLTEEVITVKDLASAPTAKIAAAFTYAAGSAGDLTNRIGQFAKNALVSTAAAVGLGFGITTLARKSMEANIELGRIEKSITGVNFAFQSWDKSLSTTERVTIAMKEATQVTDELEKAEERLAMPMSELGNIYKTIAGPAFQRLHLDQKQVIALTNKSAEAAQVFGISGEQAAMTISRALQTKTVRGMDPFANSLRDALGNMKKLGSGQILERIEKSMKNLGPAAEKMSGGLEGTMFRLRDFFEDTIRDVGMPAFKYIADRIESWRKSLASTVGDSKTLGEIWGEKIVNAIKTIERITETIAEHWKSIAVAFAAVKGAGMIAGAAGGVASAAGAIGMGSPALASLAAGIGPVVVGLGLFAAGLQFGAEKIDGWQTETLNMRGQMEGLGVAFDKLQQSYNAANMSELSETAAGFKEQKAREQESGRIALKIAQSYGVASEDAVVNINALAARLQTLSGPELSDFGKKLNIAGEATATEIAKAFSIMMGKFQPQNQLQAPGMGVFAPGLALGGVVGKGGFSDQVVNPHGLSGKPVANFYGDIHVTQDFKEQDPDRVAVGFQQGMENMAANKSMSMNGNTHG